MDKQHKELATRIRAAVYETFFHPGEVTEIRAIGCKAKSKAWSGWARDIVFGYFNAADAFGAAWAAARDPAWAAARAAQNDILTRLIKEKIESEN